jgi:hypothetical protein
VPRVLALSSSIIIVGAGGRMGVKHHTMHAS